MGNMGGHDTLRRLLRAAAPAERPGTATPARILRLAMARAAEAAAALPLSVLGVVEESLSLDDLVAALDRGLGPPTDGAAAPGAVPLSFGLARDGALAGVVVLDTGLRAALVEMQTTGRLRPDAPAVRPVTAADVALCLPLVGALIDGIVLEAGAGPAPPGADALSLVGWADDVHAAVRLVTTRDAALVLPHTVFRRVQLTLDFDVGDRQGTLTLALPARRDAPVVPGAAAADRFARALRASVMEAPATLHAVLHRFARPLSSVAAFQVGQMIALPGATVGAVRLEGPDGSVVARARLGQITGLRAVRLDPVPPADIRDGPDPPRRPGLPPG